MARKKVKKPKLRIPVAKPSKRHKTIKDYDRKEQLKLILKELDKTYVDKN